VPPTTPPTTSRGSSGTTNTDGFIAWRDAVYEWVGPAMYRTVDQMVRSDTVVAGVVLMLTMPIAEASWTARPGGTDLEDLIAAECLRRAYTEHLDWPAFVGQAVGSAAKYGHSVHEETYETVTWDLSIPLPDGTVHEETRTLWVPRRMAQRIASTIWKWNVNGLGELEGVTQMALTSASNRPTEVEIPATQLQTFTIQQEGDDYRGLSLLRAAYRSWYSKSKLEVVDAIRQERAGLGTPYAVLPEGEDMDSAGPALLHDLGSVRANEQGALVVGHGTVLGSLDLTTAADPIRSSMYHATQILWAILGAWQGLGHEGEGSRATAEVQDDPYWLLCTSVAHALEAAVARQSTARFLAYNFPKLTNPPRLCVLDITPTDVTALANAVQALTNAKVLHADPGLETHMRGVLGLPDYQPDDDEEPEPEPDPEPDPEPEPAEDDPAVDPEIEDGAPAAGNDDSAADPAGETPADKGTARASAVYGRGPGLIRRALAAVTGAPRVDATPTPFWREPTAIEAHALMGQMDALIDSQRDKLVQRCSDEVGRIAGSLILQLDDLSTEPLEIPDGLVVALAAEIRKSLQDIAAFGRFSVRHEVASQRGRPRLAHDAPLVDVMDAARVELAARPPKDPAKLDAWMEALAKRNATAIARRLLTRAEGMTDAPDKTVRAQRVRTTGESALKATATATVGNTLAAGRKYETAELAAAGEIDHAVYSALLDSNTCGPCGTLDGETYQPGSSEYERDYPPLYACDGEERCRCMMVLVAADEVASER